MSDHVDGIIIESQDMDNGSVLVLLSGDFDTFTAAEVQQALHMHLDGGRRLLAVSLEAVRYIDSTGLSALLSAARRARENKGSLVIVSTNPQINKVFNITGLTRIFPIYGNCDEAVRALG